MATILNGFAYTSLNMQPQIDVDSLSKTNDYLTNPGSCLWDANNPSREILVQSLR